MLKIEYSSRFKRDYKKIAKDQDTVAKIREVLTLLVNEKQLPAKNRPHPLAGNYQNYMECHIKPDLLLVYRINDNLLILELFRTRFSVSTPRQSSIAAPANSINNADSNLHSR